MIFNTFLVLGLLRALSAIAAEDPVQSPLAVNTNEEAPDTKHIGVKISTLFPQSEIFGVKLVNGHLTEAQLKFTNTEVNPVNVVMIGGALWAPDPKTKGETSMIVRNITSTKYNIAIPAGGDQAVTYKFSTELHPQDLRLILQSVLTRDTGEIYQVNAYNETVSVVEPDASLFDPQLIFLYLLLLGLFTASVYFIYNTWITTLFPQKKRGGKGGERAKKSSTGLKKVDQSDLVEVIGADGPAVTSGMKAYDESWIPLNHLERPEAKRSKSKTAKS